MKILVTGHRGFIGRHVFDHLRVEDGHGYHVHGLDLPDDISDFSGGDYDVVIHLAAFANIRDSLRDPESFYVNNVVKAKPLFDWCRTTGTRLLYASSSSVEENYWENPYAMTKWINEQMAPINSVGMRFYTVYAEEGGREDMMYSMLQNKTAKYVTNHKRDWIHVKDLCRAISYILASNYRGIIPIGSGKATKVTDLARVLGMNDLPLVEDTPGERMVTCADTTELRKMGWFPTKDVLVPS